LIHWREKIVRIEKLVIALFHTAVQEVLDEHGYPLGEHSKTKEVAALTFIIQELRFNVQYEYCHAKNQTDDNLVFNTDCLQNIEKPCLRQVACTQVEE